VLYLSQGLALYKKTYSRLFAFIYPLKLGRLSNSVFHQKDIHKYDVIEIVPCESKFDVDSLLWFMSGKVINLQVRVVDLFTFVSMEAHLNGRCDIDNLNARYREVLTCLFVKHNITFETNPLSCNHAVDYPDDIGTLDERSPRFMGVKVIDSIHVPESDVAGKTAIHNMNCCIPSIGQQRTFISATLGEVATWVVSTFNEQTGRQDVRVSARILLQRHVPDEHCVVFYVAQHKIFHQTNGRMLDAPQKEAIKIGIGKLVSVIKTYCTTHKQPDKVDPIWNLFACKVALNSEGTIPEIVSITGVETVYDRVPLDMGQSINVGGLIAYGGQKLVLAGYRVGPTTTNNKKSVVLYKIRNETSQTNREDFQRECMIWGSLQDIPSVLKIEFTHTSGCWAVGERLEGTISDKQLYPQGT
jgi:hypothetical protein